ncbi:glycine cleavage T C-terminal barrel domain-containing protein [Microbacterium sp. SCN 69-37]|uniref:CAF17-like 4Fe-4S cluster assembly/insertion protein YgfZ n=1 Tax=Microbacterium sp. SCN 69-37 TaxID=1660115 RepID=UPI00086EBDDE|nr:glycine cleavage T C-terminal barrel domain-containing protein [Microbacterium sp. SCN 69-37]ODT23947.1 MAG: aminomethyltransferase [Microbacterium sp. SCN 69-37]
MSEAPRPAAVASAFTVVPGAVIDERGLVHVAAPAREQRDLIAGRALAPLEDRVVVAVDGVDRLSWLDSITSQALTALAPGTSTELLVLDPQGHVEHAAGVVDDGERTWLIVDRSRSAALVTWLSRMRFRLRVEPQDLSEEVRVIGGTAQAVAALDPLAIWHDPWPAVGTGGWGYAPADPHPGESYDWAEAIVPVDAASRLAEAAASGDQPVAGWMAVDAVRVAAWRPRAATEADGRALPHEADWLRTAVHLDKGCYRGQETVAKVHNLGHPPRRLVALQLDGSDADLPVGGAEVFLGDEAVGAVTSVARHFEEGPIALAYVKRTVPVEADLTVAVDEGRIAAAQEVIVPPDAGRTASIPRMPRLSRRR